MTQRLVTVDMPNRPLRIAQWATGYIGTRAMREVIHHHGLELVGVYVHSKEKAGRDAGELCGIDPVGIKATNSIDDIIALKPDCVLYMPLNCNMDEVCRILESGSNIVTTRTEFHNPRAMDHAVRERVEAACAKGMTSIHSTGASPGFITEVMPLAVTLLERRLDLLTIDEFADVSRRDSPDLIFEVMGYGKDPATFEADNQESEREGFMHSLGLVADAIGLPVDEVKTFQEVAAARNTVNIAAGTIPAGTVGAKRITVACLRNGKPLLQQRMNWYCTTDVDADWDLRETGWRVQVDGDAPLDIGIRFPVSLDQYGAVMSGLTANPAVNAIPVVCAAQPGICPSTEIPRIIADLQR